MNLFALLKNAFNRNNRPARKSKARRPLSLLHLEERLTPATPPVFPDTTFNVSENSLVSTSVGTHTATDDGVVISYAITGGNDNNAFAINGSTGEITVNAAVLNFEAQPTYTLTVEATDDEALSTSATITINLDDVNDAPVYNDDSFSVNENSAVSTVVGTAAATDVDAGQTLSYAITAGNDNNAFAIDSNGQITVNAAVLNFEAQATYSLTVQATDDGTGTLSDAATVTINLNDVNDAPVYGDATFSVSESISVSAVVGTVAATDEDAPTQTLIYAITGGNTNNAFAINSSTGQITIAAGLDREFLPQYNLTVQVTDDGSPSQSDTATVTINVTDAHTNLTINNVSTTEFNNGTFALNFTVTSSHALGRSFTVQAYTVDGSTVGDVDYEVLTATPVTFAGNTAGETQNVTVWIKADAAVEGNETFFLRLNGGTNDINVSGAEGTGTIVDDDTAAFTIDDMVVNESAGSMTFTVSLSNPVSFIAALQLNFVNNTTTASDFTVGFPFVVFPANSTAPQTVMVSGLNDIYAEGDEQFTVTLTPLGFPAGGSVDTSDTAMGTIQDNDTTVTLASIGEDVTNSAGATVSTILGPSLVGKGLAVVGVDNTGGKWQYSTNGGTTWLELASGSTSRNEFPTAARLLSNLNKVRFVPNTNFTGTASLLYRVWDRTSGTPGTTMDLSGPSSYGGGTQFHDPISSAMITVTAANDAPELKAGSPFLTPVAVGSTNPAGDAVSAIAGHMYSDRDNNPMGIAITFLTNTANGTWQYSTNAGTSWQPIGAVSNLSALVLSGTDMVRFVPKPTFTGSASMYFRAWDGSDGLTSGARIRIGANGAKTPYSWIQKIATVVVSNNNAPVLAAGNSNLTSINEGVTSAANTGSTISSVLGSSDTDDVGALRGIAITSIDNRFGKWQVTTNPAGTAGWLNISSVTGKIVDLSDYAQTMIETSRIRFVPNLNFGGTATFTYHAWDRTFGTPGYDADLRQAVAVGGRTAFSAGTRTATITVNAVNDAPVLRAGTPELTQVGTLDLLAPGDTVGSFAGEFTSDVDNAPSYGIAIYATAGANGTWEYSTDDGATWSPIGAVSATSALLLREIDRVRFQPSDSVYNGTATISYRAWDQTGSTAGQHGTKVAIGTPGGITPFSLATQTASMLSYNDAPVLSGGSPTLASVTGSASPSNAATVATFAGSLISDSDVGALEGIAVTRWTGTGGVWEYSINGGASFQSIGVVGPASALLLRSEDLVRFRPTVGTWVGSATLSFSAWDQSGATFGRQGTKFTTGRNGGRNPFSTTGQTLVVRSNNAPAMANAGPTLTPVSGNSPAPAGDLVSSFATAHISDVDASALQGIAVTDIGGTGGTWQFSTNGGSTWSSIGPVTFKSALLLRPEDKIRFLPSGASFNGSASITYRAWDQSGLTFGQHGTKVSTENSGDFHAFSTNTQTAGVFSNKAPTIAFVEPTLASVTNPNPAGQTVASFASPGINDMDTVSQKGIAVTGMSGTGGTWQYSLNGGGSWTAFPAVSAADSLLLRDTDMVRWNPSAPGFVGTASITYRAWDRTSGTAGGTASTVTNGDPTPFSTAERTATVRSNNAPVMHASSPILPKVTGVNPAGNRIDSFVTAANLSDLDGGDWGIAVTGITGFNGTWEYSTNGSTWTTLGPVNGDNSLLLEKTHFVRFNPTSAGWAGNATITYRIWDKTTGTAGLKVSTATSGGVTAFSGGLDTASVRSNNAPVLNPAAVNLPKITSSTHSTSQVSSFAGAATADANGDAKGIAITGVTNEVNGTWYYSLNGSTWTVIGAVSETQALLLRSNDYVRFVPSSGSYTGSTSLTYRAWDQTGLTAGQQGQKVLIDATGDINPFSFHSATATVRGNTAPVAAATPATLPRVTTSDPVWSRIGDLANSAITDVDVGDAKGIAVTGLTGAGGVWEYSTNGTTAAGTITGSDSASLMLLDSFFIRFRPTVTTFNGTASLTYRAWDQTGTTAGMQGTPLSTQTYNGGISPFSAAQNTFNVQGNNSPDLGATGALPRVTNNNPLGTRVSDLANAAISDADGDAKGIAVTGLTGSNGVWEYSTNNGATYTAIGTVSASSSLLLLDTYLIRFRPTVASSAGSATISFRAWDRTSGVAGTKVSTTANGNMSSFSDELNTATVIIQVK